MNRRSFAKEKDHRVFEEAIPGDGNEALPAIRRLGPADRGGGFFLRNLRALLILLSSLSLLLLAPNGGEASVGSRYLTLDHWAYEGIRLLQGAGYLQNLAPLIQPYHRAEVAREVRALEPERLPPALAHWARLLREEFAGEGEAGDGEAGDGGAGDGGEGWGTWIEGGARASTSGRPDPLRPFGDDANLWPYGRVAGWVVAGPAALEVILLGDRFLAEDPDGIDPQRRIGRSETAYLSVAVPFGEVVIGRFARNWSRLGTSGLQVGQKATPYPQVGLELHAGRFSLHSFLGELDSFVGEPDTLQGQKRYLAAHRVDLAWPSVALSFGESILFAGHQTGFPLRHLNPVEVFYFDSDAEPMDVTQNLMLDASLWLRRGSFETYGEILLDDIDLAPPEGADREPTTYAFTVGGRWTLPSGGHTVGLEYTQVSAWAYRTPNEVDRYSYLERGLGENYSDFDRLGVWADVLAPWPEFRLTPTVEFLRQGEGDFRSPVPPYPEFLASPNLFLGTRETTLRIGLRGRYQPQSRFWLGWDAGPNIISNRGNQPGADETTFSAAVEAGLRFDLVSAR